MELSPDSKCGKMYSGTNFGGKTEKLWTQNSKVIYNVIWSGQHRLKKYGPMNPPAHDSTSTPNSHFFLDETVSIQTLEDYLNSKYGSEV